MTEALHVRGYFWRRSQSPQFASLPFSNLSLARLPLPDLSLARLPLACATLFLAGSSYSHAFDLEKSLNPANWFQGEKYEAKVIPDVPADDIYNQGLARLKKQDYEAAGKKFGELEKQYPYSQWQRKALLMNAFAQYQNGSYEDAISSAQRYYTLYPSAPDVAYAYYLAAMSNYNQIPDVSRDQERSVKAAQLFQVIAEKFPKSEYAEDSKYKLQVCRDQMAGKEMYIGRYYQGIQNYTAAVNRFREVLAKFQTTRHTEEALMRLTESYLALGIINEAQTAAAVLGHNFPESQWYKDAYALLQDKGLKPQEQPDSWIARMFSKPWLTAKGDGAQKPGETVDIAPPAPSARTPSAHANAADLPARLPAGKKSGRRGPPELPTVAPADMRPPIENTDGPAPEENWFSKTFRSILPPPPPDAKPGDTPAPTPISTPVASNAPVAIPAPVTAPAPVATPAPINVPVKPVAAAPEAPAQTANTSAPAEENWFTKTFHNVLPPPAPEANSAAASAPSPAPAASATPISPAKSTAASAPARGKNKASGTVSITPAPTAPAAPTASNETPGEENWLTKTWRKTWAAVTPDGKPAEEAH